VALPIPRDLPVLPGPRARALMVLWNPDSNLEHVVSVVEGAPALTAALLRAANSALSAPIKPVATPHEAIVRVGLDASRQVISATLLNSEFDRLEYAGLDVHELWRHLLAVGILAEVLVGPGEDRNAAFVAGLLHDIGRLSLATQNPPRYKQVVELVRHEIAAEDAERRRYGVTHTFWGAKVSAAWGLPEAVQEVAGRHHEEGATGLVKAVVDARAIAWSLGIGDGLVRPGEETLEMEPPQHEALAQLGGREGLSARIRWYREAFAPR
jgi:putative nucleotidyltransferase with HDIG domain